MMRRRRNEADARRGAARLGDIRKDFLAGQFAAFAGLGALRHFDLQFLRVDEVMTRHPEAATRDLLDRGIFRVAICFENVARRVFAAFAGVRAAPEAIHRDGQRLVRFLADRAVAHRAGLEPFDDALDGFDFLNRQRLFRKLEIEQAAQRAEMLGLVVHQFRVFARKS